MRIFKLNGQVVACNGIIAFLVIGSLWFMMMQGLSMNNTTLSEYRESNGNNNQNDVVFSQK